MLNQNKISENVVVIDSNIGENLTVYKDVNIRNSTIENKCSIGDASIIRKSKIGHNASINRGNLIFKSVIGRYSYTGRNTTILTSQIGNFCSISWNVSIGGADHEHQHISTIPLWRFELMDSGVNRSSEQVTALNCTIGNDVLISSNAIILRGVTVGNGAVIGAGAVVTKDVEPYSVVAGVPAKKIKMRFEPKVIETMKEIEWWNWPSNFIKKNRKILFSTKLDEEILNRLIKLSKDINK